MRILITIILGCFLLGCNDDSPKPFVYAKGDFWLEGFQNNSLPSKTLFNNKIYCSSINIANGLPNFLYCLNLISGKVDWATPVANWASQAPVVTDSFIYFCSYVGDIYKLNKEGKVTWESNLPGSFAGFAMHPFNNNLFVKGLESGLFEYNCANGSIVNQYGIHTMGVSLPLFTNNYMLMGGIKKDSANSLLGDQLLCFDATTRKIIWKITPGEDNKGIFIDDNKLYYIQPNPATINCINLNDGSFLWKHSYDFAITDPKLVFEKDKIILYDLDLRDFLELEKANGNVLRKFDYYTVRREHRMPSHDLYYHINANNKKYEIQVTDSLIAPVEANSELNIYIKTDQ